MRKKFFHLPLKQKFLFLYICFVLVPFLSLSGFFYAVSFNQVKTNIYFGSQTIFSQTEQLLSYYMQNVNYDLNTLVGDKNLISIAEKESSSLTSIDMVTDMLYLMDLAIIYRNKQEIQNVTIYLENHADYISDTSVIKDLSDQQNEPWYQYMILQSTAPVWIPSQYLEESDTIAVVRPIYSSYSYNTIVGIVRFDISKSAVEEMTNQYISKQSNLIYLVNSRNELITCDSDQEAFLNFSDLNSLSDGSAHERTIQKQQYISYVSEIENTDWYLVDLIPYLEIQKQLFAKNSILLLIFFAVATLGFIFVYLFFKLFLNRISALETHMTTNKNPLLPFVPDKALDDEIGSLVCAYNQMLDQVSALMKEQYHLGNHIREAEMKALYEQINPHFLYNTLSMINWLAEEEQIQDVSNVITALSNFYKLSLNQGKSLIPLRDEFQIIESFVYIQKMRFGTDITLEIFCSPEQEDFLIPKLTLQPLVENSLVHGILMKRDKCGKIEIRVSSEGDFLLICISDNGIGMDSETVSHLNQGTLQTSGKHYGIHNILQRLTLQYGEACTIHFESIPDSGVITTVKIPD